MVQLHYKFNPRVLIMIMSGAIMTCSAYLIFVYNPLELLIKRFITLSPGSFARSIWAAPPYDVFINIYIFNVTNKEEFLDGKEKLSFKEIGPYVYKEMLLNLNATFNDNETLTFNPKRYLEFVPELSVGDPNVDRIITPNIPLIGIVSSLQEASMFTNMAVSTISNMVGAKSFLNLTILEYLWGYDDRLVTLANKAVPNWINFEKFGILERLMALDNASNTVTINLNPELGLASPILTEDERKSVYHIHRWNGSPGLKQWGYVETGTNETVEENSRCNMVEGAFDGSIYPPNIKDNATLKIYRRAFCRPVPMRYESQGYTEHGFHGHTYRVDQLFLANPEENPENACYCYKNRCLPKGLGSIAPCYYDIPIVLSQPHFYNADPKLLEQFVGLGPNKTLHDTFFTLHSNMSVPLAAKLRIQINLDVGQTLYNSKTRPFNDLILPLFWLELTMYEIPTIVYVLMSLFYHILPITQTVLIYLLGIFGVALISGSALILLFFSREQTNNRLSFRGEYTPIPVLPFTSQYFKPDIRLSK